MKIYNKLVRDRIPEIIEQSGKKAKFEIIADKERVISLLESKLQEEWHEYLQNRCVEEIADMIEVLFGLAEKMGYERAELLKIVDDKAIERGRFQKGYFLISVE